VTETQNTETTETQENAQETQDRSRQRQAPQQDRAQDSPAEGPVASWRLREETQKRKEAEKELNQLRTQQQQREEEQATKQGEWQTVAEKRQAKIDQANTRIQELESQIVRDKRFRAWTQAASGIIRSEAMSDAFDKYLGEDDWSTVNEDDENSVRMLAQGLAERRNYLSAGPVGAGSGGSSRPVLGLSSNREVDDKRTTQLSSGRQTFAGFKKKRSHWK